MPLTNLYANQFEFTQQRDSTITLTELLEMPYHKFEEFIKMLNAKNEEQQKEEQKAKEQQSQQSQQSMPNFKIPKINIPKLR